MLTPQEVSTRSFTKTMMGGYNMTMVDEFLDELTNDYTALYKENASLKAKMKVLVEKVEEYRATEDSMRATLLTAQRMADTTIKEAEEKRDAMIREAEAAAKEKLESYRKEVEGYQKRIDQGREELQRFVAESRALCEKELKFLEEFPDRPLEDELAVPADEIEEKVLAAEEAIAAAAVVSEAPEAAAAPVPPAAAEPEIAAVAAVAAAAPVSPVSPAPAAEVMPTPESLLDALVAKGEETEDLSATRRVNINELKFGPNYRGAD